jgi:hypothetical protein
MIRFAQLENDKVINVTIADASWQSDGWLVAPTAEIGYTYDSIDNAFIPPMRQCGHEQLLLNAEKRWECSACDELTKII